MIPKMHLTAWSRHAPWAEQRQVEQDLIISRGIVELFSHSFLAQELRFRGGTALNKLHFPEPLRYSEDIDLVRTSEGPIKPILDAIREVLEPWLGKPAFKQSPVAPKLNFSIQGEDGAPLRLKIEINTREREAYDGELRQPYKIDNPWFSGACEVATFSNEEMLATKLRALLQRDKGRDLFDISHALAIMNSLQTGRIVEMFTLYLDRADQTISRAQAEQRMFMKLANPSFLSDMRPLVRADHANRFDKAAMLEAFWLIFDTLITELPGQPWAKSDEMREKFGLPR